MTLKSTLGSAFAATAVLVVSVWGWNQTLDNEATPAYAPRVEQPATSPDGAMEIRRMMVGDAEGNIDHEGLAQLGRAVAKKAASQASNKEAQPISWHEMGPDNVGGRTRAIVPFGSNGLYAGGVSGGLWRSNNRGNTWNQVSSFPNLMVGSLAIAGNGDLYVGTGTNFDGAGGEGGSGFRGDGIWRATADDLGSFEKVTVEGGGEFQVRATDALVADPRECYSNRVWVASMEGYGYIEDGVFTELPNAATTLSAATDMAIAPDGSFCLVAGANGRVYRSSGDDVDCVGGDFTNLVSLTQAGSSNNLDGNLPQSGVGRARVDISSDELDNGTYSAFALYATSGGLFYGLYFSDAEGNLGGWDLVWPGEIQTATPLPRAQGIYDLALGIAKGQPDLAYVGGIELWRSGPNQQAEQAAVPLDLPFANVFVHADVHEIVYANDGTMYVAGDGGIYRSDDAGETYLEVNRGYNVTQFYGMAHSAGSGVLGGTQDNGSLFIPGDGYFLSDEQAVEVNGGDGFDCAISMVTEAEGYDYAWFAASQNGGLVRGTLGPGDVNNQGDFYDGAISELINDEGEIGGFYTCTRLFENFDDEYSQGEIILINAFGQDTTGGTFELQTANQNLPFTFTMGEDETLHFWEELPRPERILDEPLTEDPDYFWLDPQEAVAEFICEAYVDTLGVDSQMFVEPVVIDTFLIIDGEEFPVTIETGDFDTTYSEPFFVIEEGETCDTMYVHAADTLYNIPERIKVQDKYSTMFVLGLRGAEGIWMTREALNFNAASNWLRLTNAPGGGGTKAIEFVEQDSEDTDVVGDVMFVTGWNGQVTRISGLRDAYSQADIDNGALTVTNILSSAGAAVTGLSIDPNDPNHVVVTVGGYGTSSNGKVRETFNALAPNPSWSNIWSSAGFNSMPCYDVVIDAEDPTGNTIVVGSEFGVFVTQDGGDSWTISNEGMSTEYDALAAPVFDLKQQFRASNQWSNITNSGAIYAGTHGRGIFVSGIATSVDEEVVEEVKETWNVFPNPVTNGSLNLPTMGHNGNAIIEVYDLTGRRWMQRSQNVAGMTQTAIDVNALPAGHYVVRMVTGETTRAAKFVVR